MVKKVHLTLLFMPYLEFRSSNYIRNLFRFCVKTILIHPKCDTYRAD